MVISNQREKIILKHRYILIYFEYPIVFIYIFIYLFSSIAAVHFVAPQNLLSIIKKN